MAEEKSAVLKIENVEESSGTRKDGSQWLRLTVVAGGTRYSIFEDDLTEDMDELLKAGNTVKLLWENQEGTYRGKPVTYHNIVGVVELEPGEVKAAEQEQRARERPATNGEVKSWVPDGIKDIMIARQVAFKGVIELHKDVVTPPMENIIFEANMAAKFLITGQVPALPYTSAITLHTKRIKEITNAKDLNIYANALMEEVRLGGMSCHMLNELSGEYMTRREEIKRGSSNS